MSGTVDNPTMASAYWPVLILRAVPAIALAAVVTFTADHSPVGGLVAFGLFATLSGAITIAGSVRLLAAGVERIVVVVQGAFSVLIGGLALVLSTHGLTVLLLVLTSFAIVTGVLELASGLHARRTSSLARDWIFGGVLTLLFGMSILLVPPGLQQQFTGPDGVARVLTASVVVVGLFGAYGAVLGIYLVIGGLSLKWAGQPHRADVIIERSN